MKSITTIYSPPPMHWVGNGFPVRTLFSYDRFGASNVSPFLMLDYAAGKEFTPTRQRRGVAAHPHKGFETVTIVYEGELEHRDSTGSGGLIGPGDVQWMTAGSGIIHEEFHSREFSELGGSISMAQLWVNLPARDKPEPPNYQTLMNNSIPRVSLEDGESYVRVIAGEFNGVPGPARTYTPINLWDVFLSEGNEYTFTVPDWHNLLIAVLDGSVQVNEDEEAAEAQLITFCQDGQEFSLKAVNNTRLLIMSGVPIDEPVVGYGPFVMNTQDEIKRAMLDFQQGKFGDLRPS